MHLCTKSCFGTILKEWGGLKEAASSGKCLTMHQAVMFAHSMAATWTVRHWLLVELTHGVQYSSPLTLLSPPIKTARISGKPQTSFRRAVLIIMSAHVRQHHQVLVADALSELEPQNILMPPRQVVEWGDLVLASTDDEHAQRLYGHMCEAVGESPSVILGLMS